MVRERSRLLASALAVLFLALVLTGTPAAEASGAVSLHAPYTGAVPFSSHIGGKAGTCTTSASAVLVHPVARISTGRMVSSTMACAATAPVSPGGWIQRTAHLETSAGFLGPTFTAAATGNHSVTYNWTAAWNATANTSGTGFAIGYAYLIANVYDNASGSFVTSAQYRSLVSWHTPFACHPSCVNRGRQLVSLSFNVTLSKGGLYRFYAELYTYIQLWSSSYCHHSVCYSGSASLVFNLGSAGRGATLRTITLT